MQQQSHHSHCAAAAASPVPCPCQDSHGITQPPTCSIQAPHRVPQGTPIASRLSGLPWYCQGCSSELTGIVMGLRDTNGSYNLKTLIMQPGCFWKIQLCVQGGKKYRFIAQILLIAFLSEKTIPLLSNLITQSHQQTKHCRMGALGAPVSDIQTDPG